MINSMAVIGPPLSGKTTVAKILVNAMHAEYISSGDVARKLPSTQQSRDAIINKDLHPDEVIIRSAIMRALKTAKVENTPLIIDGFPRTADQLQFIVDAGHKPDYIIHVTEPLHVVLERAVSRKRDEFDTEEVVRRRYEAHQNNVDTLLDCAVRIGYTPALPVSEPAFSSLADSCTIYQLENNTCVNK